MFFDDGKKSKNKKKANDDTVETSPEAVDVFVDTIIGYLEKSPESMRTVGNLVFSLLCDHVKEPTVDLILAVRDMTYPDSFLSDTVQRSNWNDVTPQNWPKTKASWNHRPNPGRVMEIVGMRDPMIRLATMKILIRKSARNSRKLCNITAPMQPAMIRTMNPKKRNSWMTIR
jgi:hypothetical protein